MRNVAAMTGSLIVHLRLPCRSLVAERNAPCVAGSELRRRPHARGIAFMDVVLRMVRALPDGPRARLLNAMSQRRQLRVARLLVRAANPQRDLQRRGGAAVLGR